MSKRSDKICNNSQSNQNFYFFVIITRIFPHSYNLLIQKIIIIKKKKDINGHFSKTIKRMNVKFGKVIHQKLYKTNEKEFRKISTSRDIGFWIYF